MSHCHEFIISNSSSLFVSNPIFFGKGLYRYDRIEATIFLLKIKEVAELWAKKKDIKKYFFGYMVSPYNSLPSGHCHLIDLDKIHYIDILKNFFSPSFF